MPSKSNRFTEAVSIDPSNIKANPYIRRLIEDAKLRADMLNAFESSKRAYVRLTNGKTPRRALIEDKKLQRELRQAVESLRDASIALSEAPKHGKKKRRFGRRLMFVFIAAAFALAGSEKLRSKVLDTLFGAEEEFEYTPPPPPPPATPTPPASPVSSA